MSELWDAAYYGDHDKLNELINHSKKSDIDWKNTSADWCDVQTPLHISAACGHLSCVELLLTAGADRNCKSSTGCTPLFVSSSRNYPSCVSALLATDVQVDLADNYGRTPLMVAATYGHTAVVKLLLDAGANRELTNDGKTALDLAIMWKKCDVVDKIKEHELLERCARPEVVTGQVRSAHSPKS